MSAEYEGQDPIALAAQAERDLNTQQAKGNTTKHGVSDSTLDSGIDASATTKFPGATVTTGAAASGREIPLEQGGVVLPTGQVSRDQDFEGVGGPEDKAAIHEAEHGGDDAVRGNIRQGGETRRPGGGEAKAAREGAGGASGETV